MKLSDAQKDYYRKLAKEEGYRSRSAFKLIQLNKAYRILKPGYSVVDLGCAPGGWLQVARTAVSQSGKVIGVDIEKVAQLEGTTILQGDIENAGTIDLLMQTLNGKANTLLSDISPKISGIWDIDHSKQISLSKSSMNIATETLVRGGNAVLKVFEGEFLNGFNKEVKAYFNKVLMTKPVASRQQSSELYMVCLGFRSNE
ncbi:MAG: RlmE family RNA methyltransferase [Nitrososphaeraceae archaeon]|jgi:23S rRNA (uridine2552-2'-O)-methyltransferase|nr:RlmE family RNA methyltransferase [Nitrososphaeraceae archaeon]MDW0314075.1 RlmE family RNA methyltransferase [Nitrososphaeraceae archaeon]MDW0332754.1 RlmE family RNA methyltransferase [Nitrososphaeraceae archaeon]